MKKLYLVRHGEPAFPQGRKLCLGRTELPLSELGFIQAQAAAEALKDENALIFTSPLLRARQTAEAFSPSFRILEGLQEIYQGEWDGLSFDEIKLRYPGLYAARGRDRSLRPPGAEDNASALRRFYSAMEYAAGTEGDSAVIISHAGIMELFLQSIGAECHKPAYCEILQLCYNNNEFHLTGGNCNARLNENN